MIDGKYKMVVVETPEADRILKDVKLTLTQLKNIVRKAAFSDRRIYMVVREEIKKKAGVNLSRNDSIILVNIILHFGTKAVHGSDYYQQDGKVTKRGAPTNIKNQPDKLLETK